MTQKDEPRPNVPRNANAANRGLVTHSPDVQTKPSPRLIDLIRRKSDALPYLWC